VRHWNEKDLARFIVSVCVGFLAQKGFTLEELQSGVKAAFDASNNPATRAAAVDFTETLKTLL
jgi:hypothetical protein